MNPDYEETEKQLYTYSREDIDSVIYAASQNKSKQNSTASMTARIEAERKQQLEDWKLHIKAALMMLEKYKGCHLALDDISLQAMWAAEDPLGGPKNCVATIRDMDKFHQLQYTGFGMDNPGLYCRFVMMLTNEAFSKSYTPDDYNNGIKQGEYPTDTMICMRLAVMIWKAWKQHIR